MKKEKGKGGGEGKRRGRKGEKGRGVRGWRRDLLMFSYMVKKM